MKLPARQSGTILITVVLISAFVVVLVLESIKTVRYQKQLSTNLINRDQAYSYLMGMEELAKIWLKKAFEESKEKVVHLKQPWAQDNITFPIDGGGMTASIRDMQSCFNLNSIALPAAKGGAKPESDNPGRREPPGGKEPEKEGNNRSPLMPGKDTPGQKVLVELIAQVNKDSEVRPEALAMAVKDWIDEDIDSDGVDGAEDDYYQSLDVPYRTANNQIAHVSELRVIKGFNAKIYQLLLPNICVLPDKNVNQINVNTIKQGAEVIVYSVLGSKKITLSDVKSAIANRGDKGFESVEQFTEEFGDKQAGMDKTMLTVKSEYFQMQAKAEIGTTRVAMKTLFKKDDKNNFKVISRYFGKE